MKKEPRKVPGHAILKNLPAESQAEVLEHCQMHKLTDTVKWLADRGIKASFNTVSRWRRWYERNRNFAEGEKRAFARLEYYRRLHPKMTTEELVKMGEFLFNAIAVDEADVQAWSMAQKIQLQRESQAQDARMVDNATKKQDLELQKFKEQCEKARQVTEDTDMTPEEKDARYKEILGIE